MYSPLIKALNNALHLLSAIEVPGLPKFEPGRQIVFARSDATYTESESHAQGQYKPDIVLLRWKTFNKTQRGKTAAAPHIAHGPTAGPTQEKFRYEHSFLLDTCCKSGGVQPKLNWRNLLSTLEVKRGGIQGAGGRSVKATYASNFEDLSAGPTTAEPQTSPPPPLLSIARPGYSTKSRMSISPSTFVRPFIHPSPHRSVQ